MEATVIGARIRERSNANVKSDRDWRDYAKKPRVYVWPQGETILQNLQERKNRPIRLFRDLAVKALAEHNITATKMRWSQYAGCTCPCSPGFILEQFESPDIPARKFDAHITVA